MGLAVVALLAVTVLSVATAARSASADWAPYQCDPYPSKYYCLTVNYSRSTSSVTVNSRWYMGGRDGGAQQWRLEYVRDYTWNPSTGYYHQTHGWGPFAWQTNIPLSGWYTAGYLVGVSNDKLVRFRMQYEECTPTDGCYYWYGGNISGHNDFFIDTL
jgi:hypothetical protein